MDRDSASLLDMYKAAQKIQQFSLGLNRLALAENEEKQAAILYQVIIMGEAAKRLSEYFRQQHPDIPWRDIAGMRDIVTHQYDRVNFSTLWDVVSKDVPEILSLLEALLPKT